VQALYPCPGGHDGEMFLCIPAGKSWRPMLHSRGDSLTVCRRADPWCPVKSESPHRSSSTHGWPDLALGRNLSPTARRVVGLKFDGNVYRATVCNDMEYPNPGYSPCPSGWKASEQ
jgi:hypothetical protein